MKRLGALWRSYYDVNRATYGLSRPAAAWDAAKCIWYVRNA